MAHSRHSKGGVVVSRPLLPITEKGMTRREAADLFRGLAELVESYPATGLVVSVDLGIAATGDTTPKSTGRRKPRAGS